ncbi:MAG: GerW family sporulation protein [Bacteroidetes bacterium]|nr:GerW family sporulation protein [Bacteroidota bacterium]
MKTNFEELIKGMTEFLKSEAKTETIIGKEFKLGEFSCVPVIALGMGVGGGEGMGNDPKHGQGEGGGGGAGMGMTPIGFLISRAEQIQFISTKSPSGINAAFEKLPDLLLKYFESRKKESAVTN